LKNLITLTSANPEGQMMTFAFLRNTTAFTAALIGSALLGGTSPVIGASITYSDPLCESFTIEGSNGNFTLRCVAAQGPSAPGAPTGCVPSISTTPSALTSAGGTVNLNVTSCTATGTLTYSWSRNGSAGWKTEKSPTDTLAANTGASGNVYSYQVKVCVEGGACTNNLPAAPLTATVPGTGGGVGAISCAAQGFSKTMFYNWNWASGAQFVQTYNDPQGPLGNNGIIVIAFTPTAAGTTNGSISASEYPANPLSPLGITRAVAISEQPCDLSGTTVQYGTKFGYNVNNGFTVEPASMRSVAKLTVGKQYYLNIANRDSAGNRTCTGSTNCELRMQATHP
jgi:hypothetical protein